ncbi:MAG TPA: glucose-6-phosphate dehydrogenase, partial [Caulobacteraceae bacterium]
MNLVIFGGGGDLALRMLHPSLVNLERDGLLPGDLKVWAVARKPESQEAFLARVEAALPEDRDSGAWTRLSGRLTYVALDATSDEGMERLAQAVGRDTPTVFYMAVSPTLYAPICRAIAAAGLDGDDNRIVLEKPLGRDLETFRAIDATVHAVFPEERILRIDHYLGKEAVQNLMALRFANTLFEPLWNNLSIEHVQITIAETQGVGDRWPYYDEYGALRDMLQNHLLQLLCLTAMEPPSDLDPDSLRNEKVKVLRSLRPFTAETAATLSVRGQYGPGLAEDGRADGYVQERGAPSDTETFVAIEAYVDNWRWGGVPFYLRTGKRMPEKRTEIVIQFKPLPHSIFKSEKGRDEAQPNRLVIRLQPEEDISLLVMNKAPGLDRRMKLQALPLSLSWG